jgi:hypothetical protein
MGVSYLVSLVTFSIPAYCITKAATY